MTQEFGSELVTNGDFGAITGWSLAAPWTYNGDPDFNVSNSSAGWSEELLQMIASTAGKRYLVTASVTIEGTVSAGVRIGSGSYAALANGANSIDLIAGGGTQALQFQADVSPGGSITIDDVSVKEIIAYYKVYRGQDGDIDYTAAVATMRLADTQVSITGQDLPANTIWHYVRRLYKACCGKESPDSPVCIVRIGPDGQILGEKPNPPDDLIAEPLAGGVVQLRWRYWSAGQEAAPAGFVIYQDTLDAPIAAVPAGGGLQGGYRWVSGALTHGQSYQFCVRAYAADGELSDNSNMVSAVADSQGPPAIDGLAAEWEEI